MIKNQHLKGKQTWKTGKTTTHGSTSATELAGKLLHDFTHLGIALMSSQFRRI
jgi:hypothetical protein